MNINNFYERSSDLLNQLGSSLIWVYSPERDIIECIDEQEVFSTEEDLVTLPYENDLIPYGETVQLYEAETGLDFETYHKGVADRIRQSGHEHQFREFQLNLLDKLMDDWLRQHTS